MTGQAFQVEPVAYVVGGRSEPTDDYWGGTRAVIRIDGSRFGPDSTAGLEEFSHLEVVFRFHLTDPADLNLGARRPRDNPDWPPVGIFGHRNMRRLNWLGVSRCRLLKVDGLGAARRGPGRGRRYAGPRHQAVVRRHGTTREDPAGTVVRRDAPRLLRHSDGRLRRSWLP